jgi:hypothetical protein
MKALLWIVLLVGMVAMSGTCPTWIDLVLHRFGV